MGKPQRHALVGRNHTGTPSHPLHWVTKPTDTCTLPADRHHLLLTIQGDAIITPTEGNPMTATPAHGVHIPRQASSAPMTVRPGPTPWQAIIVTYPAPSDHTDTWQHKFGGPPWGSPPGTPRTHAHAPHAPTGERSSPGATRHGHPGVMVMRHAHKPTSGGGHSGHPICPPNPNPDPTAQHPTRLPHLVGISRPRNLRPPTSPPPPRLQHHCPPPSRNSGSRPGGGPAGLERTVPGQDQSSAAREIPRKSPGAKNQSTPHSN